MTVADRIRDRRIELNMTQKELSDKIGTKDRSSVSKIETKGDDISMKDIIRISEALDVTPQYLLGWESEEERRFNNLKKHMEALMQRFPDEKANDISKAIEFYEKYQKAIPQVQAAVEALLKDNQPGS